MEKSGTYGMTIRHSDKIRVSVLKSGILIFQASPPLEDDERDKLIKRYRSIITEEMGLGEDVLP